MNPLTDTYRYFESMGGIFCLSESEFIKIVNHVQGFLFDWDGVFHSGQKGESRPTTFCEADSMGTNMLRYGFWRKYGKLPFAAIISGQGDKTVYNYAKREHFDGIYTGIRDKKLAMKHACRIAGLKTHQMACLFDDIIDLPMAKECGLRMMVRRDASPLFLAFSRQQGLCDYVTAQPAENNAVRECCELVLGLWGNYSEVVESRINFDADYQEYLHVRNKILPQYYQCSGDQIAAINIENFTNGGEG